MLRLVLELVRPYRGWLAIVFAAMMVEIAMSLAAPWPLKLVLDDALGNHTLPEWAAWAHDMGIGRHTWGVALFAGLTTLAIAIVGAIATYVDNYYTTSVGQWVANDLRIRIHAHLHRLSLGYCDSAKTGTLMSTITGDVSTAQGLASPSTLGIIVDLTTIVFMLGLMFWLDWDFTLIAIGVTPFLLMFVLCFKKAVKKATRDVGVMQSEVVAVAQDGLGSVRAVKAFGRQDIERQRMGEASRATVAAALKARRVKSLLSPVVGVVVALCTGIVLWRGTALIIAGTLTAGALTVYLAYLNKFFKPVKDLASMTSAIAQTTVALERIQTILSADDIIRERADAIDPGQVRGESTFEHVAVGERGDTLSGGQRQRIGIARAVIRSSPIMILDEPTTALDTESERLVIEGLQQSMKGRTVITVAHRLSTIRDADKIIVLKDGGVVEEGTNDELIARGGVCAELHRIQFETPQAQTGGAPG